MDDVAPVEDTPFALAAGVASQSTFLFENALLSAATSSPLVFRRENPGPTCSLASSRSAFTVMF